MTLAAFAIPGILLHAGCGKPLAQGEQQNLARAGAALRRQTAGASDAEWTVHGRDKANTKYSPLNQIHRGNVKNLQVAWRWASLDNPARQADGYLLRTMFEATPLMVGGSLFLTTSFTRVAALDGATGAVQWIYDPESHKFGSRLPLGIHSRGVAYWQDGEDRRIVFGTSDAYLVSLDARTGVPTETFGNKGRVDLTQGLRRPVQRRFYSITSPPIISRDVIVVGSWTPDMPIRRIADPGDVRGFDVRTGKLLWTFHTIPQENEVGNRTWENGSWKDSGNTNVWSIMSADDELGYVYLPVSMPTDNFYGGARPGDNLFGDSLVCLDVRTGKRIWHYQMVHHDIWDYDVPAPPNLIDIEVGGKRIRAVAQVLKSGSCFVFDRVTGQPVWPIEERSVPQSRIPGEKTSLSQPFPVKPPPFERLQLLDDDLIDFTPELKAEAARYVSRYDHGPLYTPPSERGAVLLPGWSGGANWGGAAFDPETHMLYVPSITSPILLKMRSLSYRTLLKNWFGAAEDTIEAKYEIDIVLGPELSGGLPLTKPPYGRITAYDMDQGEIRWQVANGRGPVDHPLLMRQKLSRLGSTGRTSVMVAKELLFAGEGPSSKVAGGEPYFRAYDKKTGEVLWEVQLDSHVVGAPMTYLVNGKQYVVVACGGFGEKHELVAFALP